MEREEVVEKILEKLSRDQILMLLRSENASGKTLDNIGWLYLHDEEVCRAILEHPGASVATLSHIARNAPLPLVEWIAQNRVLLRRVPEVREALLGNPCLSPDLKGLLQVEAEEADEGVAEETEENEKAKKKKDLYRTIKELSTGQRLALAKKGNKEVRLILIRDANEMIALEVINSPRITDSEILYISQMRDVSEKVLRGIATNRRYRSNKQLVLNLLHNPKTPASVSLGLGITRLSDRELSGLAKDKNIPGVVARAASLVLEKRKKAISAPKGGH
jgi:hypothetical protein